MKTISPALLGFIRGIGVVVLVSVLSYIEDASHLTGVLNPVLASAVAAIALAIEHSIASSTGKALFGAARV